MTAIALTHELVTDTQDRFAETAVRVQIVKDFKGEK